jgi:hypothetical protein
MIYLMYYLLYYKTISLGVTHLSVHCMAVLPPSLRVVLCVAAAAAAAAAAASSGP